MACEYQHSLWQHGEGVRYLIGKSIARSSSEFNCEKDAHKHPGLRFASSESVYKRHTRKEIIIIGSIDLYCIPAVVPHAHEQKNHNLNHYDPIGFHKQTYRHCY